MCSIKYFKSVFEENVSIKNWLKSFISEFLGKVVKEDKLLGIIKSFKELTISKVKPWIALIFF